MSIPPPAPISNALSPPLWGDTFVGIVVAIIGILASLAIPNFLSYQLKPKTIEAKTNLAGIKTVELTFSADRSCYLSVQNNGWPGIVPVNGAQIPWPVAATAETGKTDQYLTV